MKDKLAEQNAGEFCFNDCFTYLNIDKIQIYQLVNE